MTSDTLFAYMNSFRELGNFSHSTEFSGGMWKTVILRMPIWLTLLSVDEGI